jgi:hypothetical protein
MYRLPSGEIFKVQRSKTSGHLYAKNLRPIGGQRITETGHAVAWEFTYAQGAMRALTAQHLMSVEEAREFGIAHGVCCVCGSPLKDARSVSQGIGPICIKSQSWKSAHLQVAS